jgi:DNA-binding PadR family transcriptional regulator
MSLHGAVAALLLGGPSYGYQLHATLEAELGPLWETRASHLYLTLGRMQRDGLISGARVRQQNRPDRMLVRLTPVGRAHAETWLVAGDSPQDLVIRLAIARIAVPKRFEAIADGAVQEGSEKLQHLRSLRKGLDSGFQTEAVDLEIMRVKAEIRWAASMRDRAVELLRRPRATIRGAVGVPDSYSA